MFAKIIHNTKGWMIPGLDNLKNRPGSYTLVMKSQQYSQDKNRWITVFFCEVGGWVSPNGYWQIVYLEPDESNGYGACYIDWGPDNAYQDYDLCKYDKEQNSWTNQGDKNNPSACYYDDCI